MGSAQHVIQRQQNGCDSRIAPFQYRSKIGLKASREYHILCPNLHYILDQGQTLLLPTGYRIDQSALTVEVQR